MWALKKEKSNGDIYLSFGAQQRRQFSSGGSIWQAERIISKLIFSVSLKQTNKQTKIYIQGREQYLANNSHLPETKQDLKERHLVIMIYYCYTQNMYIIAALRKVVCKPCILLYSKTCVSSLNKMAFLVKYRDIDFISLLTFN